MTFADIFAWTVDFLTEPRDGDTYALSWMEKATAKGFVAERKIQWALYDGKNTGRQLALLFNGYYYNDEGQSMRKAFLRAPLNFRRISSGFTHRRFHPILRYFRPHLGIDYAAPTGTPIVSIGSGSVIFKGWKNGYGNTVRVRHNGTYTTYYSHLSRFAKGLRTGQGVQQGHVVGYVGQTGHATGPHLDFRILRNGQPVNFIKLKLPSEKGVSTQDRPAFEALRNKYREELKDG
jgi:murein DD-endopeptidase MepM/ murein hydrolase activator NlpD